MIDEVLTIYLCRHGETEENLAHILQGHMPGHLTAAGCEQARLLGETLRPLAALPIVCSDLQRCVDTAHIAFGPSRPIELEPLLRERDWGCFTGRPYKDGSSVNDPSVESVEALFLRAATLLRKWAAQRKNAPFIAISHGLFLRALIAVAQAQTIRDIPRFGNAEVRCLTIPTPLTLNYAAEETGRTAN